jgi:glycosyltransferase involved in cell wall biosynthesis
MKIVVNAVTCRVAGGRSVALNFLRCYREGAFPHDLVVLAPADCGYEELAAPRIEIHPAPEFVHRGLLRPWVDNVWMRRILAAERPDVLFNMGSIATPARYPQLVLFHWPYAIYPEREVWERMTPADQRSRRVRRWFFVRRLRFVTRFAAQTETARGRLQRIFGLRNVSIVPNAVSVGGAPADRRPDCLPDGVLAPGRRALLCLTRYYPHKNLEVLVELGRRIRDAGAPFVVLLTLSPDEDRAVAPLLSRIEAEALGDVVVNLGRVPMEDVPALYSACDALLLPTLLESFSGTFVESMHYGRPVFTSDRDFAHEVCGDAAWYFDPHSAREMLGILQRAFADPVELQRRIALGRARAAELPGWPEVTARYVSLLEALAAERDA